MYKRQNEGAVRSFHGERHEKRMPHVVDISHSTDEETSHEESDTDTIESQREQLFEHTPTTPMKPMLQQHRQSQSVPLAPGASKLPKSTNEAPKDQPPIFMRTPCVSTTSEQRTSFYQNSYKGQGYHPERRYVMKPTSRKKSPWQSNVQKTADTVFNHQFTSLEQAEREQERLLQQAASRVRQQAHCKIVSGSDIPPMNDEIAFSSPVNDVDKRYPHHWKFKNPYARLGLPVDSRAALVKRHYRKLSRMYHPDKSHDERTIPKFQAITEAYRDITP